jgi:erythritol transport system substrate-binding protein
VVIIAAAASLLISSASAQEKKLIAIIVPSPQNPFFKALTDAADAKAKQPGYDCSLGTYSPYI